MPPEKTELLRLDNIHKSFNGTPVLRGVSLTVREGEFVTLLGASGSGKTTLLRIVAGLESPDEGEVFLAGEKVTHLPPEKRNVNTVFQNYALFPHMNVEKNISYSLRLKGASHKEQVQKAREALELVRLQGYGHRWPHQLSGGQRQRVAIARAAVASPRALLLDEPLGALDLNLRREMQTELKRLQKALGMSFIYITHDQEEALNLSDRLALLHEGVIEQEGPPDEVYTLPKTAYAARFLGSANLLEGTAIKTEGQYLQFLCAGAECQALLCKPTEKGESVLIALRAEHVRLFAPKPDTLLGKVEEKRYTGGVLHMAVRMQNGFLLTAQSYGPGEQFPIGSEVTVGWQPGAAVQVEP